MVAGLSDPLYSESSLDGNSGVVVLLMGQTGVGKSHFINVAAGEAIAPVYPGLAGGTGAVKAYRVRKPSILDPGDPQASVILVDTPGLDNYYLDDLAILEKIRSWINDRCCSDVKFGGILYLEDITCNRVWPVERFATPERSKRLMLATTNWDQKAPIGCFERREQELVRGRWKGQLDEGAKYRRFRNTQQTAWEILDELLQTDPLPVHVLEKDLKKVHQSMTSRRKKEPRWQIRIRGLLPRLPSIGSIVAQVVLSKDDQSERAKPIAATVETIYAATPHLPDSCADSATDTGDLHGESPTASFYSPTNTTFSTFDTESIVSSTETAFFSIEPVDSEGHDRRWTTSPEPIWLDETGSIYPAVEDVSLNISQEPGASIVTISSTSTLSSNFTQSTTSESESDPSDFQTPLSTSTTILPAATNPERSVTRDVERVVANFFQSANRLNIQNLNITVHLCNQDVPNR